MSEFDPSMPAMVYDQLNVETFEWPRVKYREHYDCYAHEHRLGVSNGTDC